MTKKPQSARPKPSAAPLETAPSMRAAAASWDVPLAVLKAAKAAGCSAFHSSGRIRRTEFLAWLAANSEDAEQAVSLDLEKAEKAELEKEKLRAQIQLLRSRNERESRELISMGEACGEWARVISIDAEEAKQFMERDHYRVWCERTKTRIGSMLQLTPEEMIEAIRKFYTATAGKQS